MDLAKFLDTLAKSLFLYKNLMTGKLTYLRRRIKNKQTHSTL